MISAASSNSRPRRSHVPNRRQIALRSPCVAPGVMTSHRSLPNDFERAKRDNDDGRGLHQRFCNLRETREEMFHVTSHGDALSA
jgi:hypothetical protein